MKLRGNKEILGVNLGSGDRLINGRWEECLEDGHICLDEQVFGLLFDHDRIAVLSENTVIGELIDDEDDDSLLINKKWHIFVEIFDPSSDAEAAEHERERIKKKKPKKK